MRQVIGREAHQITIAQRVHGGRARRLGQQGHLAYALAAAHFGQPAFGHTGSGRLDHCQTAACHHIPGVAVFTLVEQHLAAAQREPTDLLLQRGHGGFVQRPEQRRQHGAQLALLQAPAHHAQAGLQHRGCAQAQRLEVLALQEQGAGWAQREHACRGHATDQELHLCDRLAGADRVDAHLIALAVPHADLELPTRHHEQSVSGLALAQQRLACGQVDGLQGRSQPLAQFKVQAAEARRGGQQRGDIWLFAGRHGRSGAGLARAQRPLDDGRVAPLRVVGEVLDCHRRVLGWDAESPASVAADCDGAGPRWPQAASCARASCCGWAVSPCAAATSAASAISAISAMPTAASARVASMAGPPAASSAHRRP